MSPHLPLKLPPETNERSVSPARPERRRPTGFLARWLRHLPFAEACGSGPRLVTMREILADLEHGRT